MVFSRSNAPRFLEFKAALCGFFGAMQKMPLCLLTPKCFELQRKTKALL
jgi:hypothetical protein